MDKRNENASDMAQGKNNKKKNYKVEDTDDENFTTDDDLDEPEVRREYTRKESIPVAPITINVTAYSSDDRQLAKATRNNVLSEKNRSSSSFNEAAVGVDETTNQNDEVDENNEENATTENQVAPNRIRMQIDKRLLEILKLALKDFVMLPVPVGLTICTRIVRDKASFSKGIYPVYRMYIDMYNGFLEQSLLMTARRRQKSKKICYMISVDKKQTDETLIGKLKSNLLGTAFNAYNHGTNPKTSLQNRRSELAYIMYQLNPMGFNGPRRFSAAIPCVDQSNGKRVDISPQTSDQCISKRVKKKDFREIILLENKEPEWNDAARTYQLDFKNRVSEVSVKNFQLVHPENKSSVLLQSGRVGENEFTCDFTFPFCPYQAFAIGLSSLTDKIGCA